MSTWGDMIKEFKMYNMKHFVVVDKREKVRATQVRWSLVFGNRTTVEEVDLPAFPLEAFRFRTISEIFNLRLPLRPSCVIWLLRLLGRMTQRTWSQARARKQRIWS